MYEFENEINNLKTYSTRQDFNEAALFIGPEGGFDVKEINQLKEAGWKSLSLGERKLRAETAAIISAYEILNKTTERQDI
jgi:16S rRNA (uracil1498-N3)-methyltransferase